MKLTPNAAMRARDVSRPHPEHLAEAEAAEASRERPERAGPDPRGEAAATSAGGNGRAARPGFPRRRRGPRDGRGRSAR